MLGAPASYHLMSKPGGVLMNTVDYAAEQAMVDLNPLTRQALPELVVVFQLEMRRRCSPVKL